jgi:uncharacterized protein (TIGR02453 family)
MAVDAPSFTGFSSDAIQFLVELADHNDRAWFQPRKGDYERLLKEPMASLCVALDEQFKKRGIPLEADAKRSPFRIYRDTRFSKDKSPYKTHLAASFPWVDAARGTGSGPHGGDDDLAHGNGGYFHFQPGEMYIGGGMWHPTTERLTQFRRAVVDEPDRVTAAVEDRKFVKWFGGVESHEMLKRVPPGYPADHPMADLLRQKDLVFGKRLADKDVLSPDLPDLLADGFDAAMPVFRFLATLR